MTQSVSEAAPSSRHPALDWLPILVAILTVFNGLPFLAPVFMKLGWEAPARVIYFIYGFLCHQMAQRSFFLFGPQGFQMYNASQLPVNSSGPDAPLLLRDFLGNPDLGWKVAWSDRMVSMYISPLLAALIYWALGRSRRVRPLSLWMLMVLITPMALDGGTHFLSDLFGGFGIGAGFRDTNLWLATLTGHAFPDWFYNGDALGSFNSSMRIISGLLFGAGLGWTVYPYFDESGELPGPISRPA